MRISERSQAINDAFAVALAEAKERDVPVTYVLSEQIVGTRAELEQCRAEHKGLREVEGMMEDENERLRERVASLMLDEPSKTAGLYAAVDELQARIAELEAENVRLRGAVALDDVPPEVHRAALRLLAGFDPWAPDGPQNATEWGLCAAAWRAIAVSRGGVSPDLALRQAELATALDLLHRCYRVLGPDDLAEEVETFLEAMDEPGGAV